MDKLQEDNLNFDDLKGLWQSNMETNAAHDPSFNNQKILIIMQEKTSAAVQKLRRNLLIEILTSIPLLIGGYFLVEARGIHLPLLFWMGVLLMTIGYHVYLYWKLQNETVSTASVSETIQKQHAVLQRFMKMYDIWAIVGGIALSAASGWFFYVHFKEDVLIFAILLAFSLSTGYGFYVLFRGYVQRLYGQYYAVLGESLEVLGRG
jgi:hypothetical protein